VHYYQRDLALIHDRGYGLRQLTLPGDPLPPADAVVSVGHVLSYLPDAAAIEKALTAAAGPGACSPRQGGRHCDD
jgi:hypothetical protein